MKRKEFAQITTAIADLIDHTQSDQFPTFLKDFLATRLQFSNMFIFRFSKQQKPKELYSWVPEKELNHYYHLNYSKVAFELDPFYQLSKKNFNQGIYLIKEISPDRFFSTEYYKSYYKEAQMGDEIGFLKHYSDEMTIHLSIGRLKHEPSFTKYDQSQLQAMEKLLSVLLSSYFDYFQASDPPSPMQALNQSLEIRLISWTEANLPHSLTTREAQIAALILRGHSSMSAGLTLEIATETVKVHRRNLYRKLNVNTQAQLFARLIPLIVDS